MDEKFLVKVKPHNELPPLNTIVSIREGTVELTKEKFICSVEQTTLIVSQRNNRYCIDERRDLAFLLSWVNVINKL